MTPIKVIILAGRFVTEGNTDNYNISQFYYQELFQNSNADNVIQDIQNNMKYLGLQSNLLIRKTNGDLLSFNVINKYRFDRITTHFSLLEG